MITASPPKPSKIKSIKFFSKKLDFREITLTVPRKPLYSAIPYFGHKSVLLVKEISNLISENFPHIDPKLILVNKNKIDSFFKHKDALPKSLQASIVYEYSCPQSNCGSAYVGSTVRTLRTRALEHKGVSIYTGLPLASSSSKQSSIRSHVLCSVGVGMTFPSTTSKFWARVNRK